MEVDPKTLAAWCRLVEQSVYELGPECYWVTWHRPDDFDEQTTEVHLREQFPQCDPIEVVLRQEQDRWRRVA